MNRTVNFGSRLRYPITIVKILKSPGTPIKKQEVLLTYSFEWTRTVGDHINDKTWEETTTTVVNWESPIDGDLKKWFIKEGDVIKGDCPCMTVKEECPHDVQFSGLCARCGKDMTEVNWAADTRDADRAPISMVHDQTSLTVSKTQAVRTEETLQRRLLQSRKLSLVVDLDQTIIHACIDPTVGEWQRDPTNPNYESVKNVKTFQLEDGPRGVARGCWYYIKMRPGLEEFLQRISTMYELHVYTMGTRAYAQNVARIVDPNRKLFGNRVISRDENGNMYAKSLQRLFPVSTDMVLIIDDRADVWPNNRTNLIKVSPYEFFKGIGDINSSFLPKRQDLLTDAPGPAAANGKSAKEAKEAIPESPAVTQLQLEEQERTLEKQIKERPLQILQEKLDKEEEEAEKASTVSEDGEDTPSSQPHHRHQVLSDDDSELEFLEQHLTQIHKAYYEEYDRRRSRKLELDIDAKPDVGDVMDDVKSKALEGCRIVLSGIIPMGIDVLSSEIGLQLKSFGAQIRTSVSRDVTHLVVSTLRPRTSKVRQAAEIPSIKIVSQEWLSECFCKWKKADEKPYLFDVHPDDRPGGKDSAGTVAATGDTETEMDEGEETDARLTNGKPRRKIRLQNPRLRIVNPQGVSHKLEEDDEDSDDEDDGEIDDDLDDEFSPYEPEDGELSPTERLKGFDWGDVDDELEAFMEESTDEDDEAKTDDDSRRTAGKKRKYATDDEGETGSESDRVDEEGNVLSSKRVRRARQPLGGSSLKNQYAPEGNDDNSSLPTPQVTGEEDGYEDMDEAELEADFMAEFEAAEVEEDEEDQPKVQDPQPTTDLGATTVAATQSAGQQESSLAATAAAGKGSENVSGGEG
ncbi:RNA polymerase II subunit A C-terminal domain phosphatase [Rhypophila decipiens]|uniref:RNA polymerase II subunit A C-terminal domain phosphatase n=1 Tax=Rhypophila decipiens TaxID=261697 RepID=A0AAN6Y0T1_9PEZI|nr:RNA polymerase II subunit A C-terminal domain phosphatase [Rhypophila decipiens]